MLREILAHALQSNRDYSSRKMWEKNLLFFFRFSARVWLHGKELAMYRSTLATVICEFV